MGWSYRRSIKIAPGIRLNFSKSGVSWTIGPKEFKVTSGPRGVYVTKSIPGTGLYSRSKVNTNKITNAGQKNRPELPDGCILPVFLLFTSLVCTFIAQKWIVCPIVFCIGLFLWLMIPYIEKWVNGGTKLNHNISENDDNSINLKRLNELLEQMNSVRTIKELSTIYNQLIDLNDNLYISPQQTDGYDYDDKRTKIRDKYFIKLKEIVELHNK